MSGDVAAPVEASAPQSSQDIAASVVQEADTAPEVAAPVSADAPVTPAAPVSDAEALLREEGYNPKRIDGRDNLIPWSRVAKIIEKGISEGRGEFGQKYQKLTTDYDTTTKEAAELRAFRDEFATALRGDPRQFLSEIAKHDPRYASFLQQQIEAAKPVIDDDPEPPMDYDLGDGRKTYTAEGLRKVREWDRRQVQRELDKLLQPFKERDAQDKQRAELERANQATIERTRSTIETAKAWPNWTDYEPDVLKTLQEDSATAAKESRRPTMTLREAYLEVQAKALAADDTTKRAQWLEAMQKAPKSTSIARPGVEATRKPGPRSSADVARETIAQLEKSS